MIDQQTFDNLQPDDRVRTNRWGDGIVKRRSGKFYVVLYNFSNIPANRPRHCPKYSISEIECKL